MSIVPKENIEVIAQSLGINNISPDVLPNLASDVEYSIQEIMQVAIKCMRHSRRTTTDNVDSALSMRNVEPLYGFASGHPRRFKGALGHKDLFYVDEKDVELKDEPEELFETISQALISSIDCGCLSGWGGRVYVVTSTEVTERLLKGRMD